MEIIEEKDEFIPADCWSIAAALVNPAAKERQRRALSSLVDAYLANGGLIQRVAMGTITKSEVTPAHPSGGSPGRAAAMRRAGTARSRAHRAKDGEHCKAIGVLLDIPHIGKTQLADALGVSEDKSARLVKEYFAEDPRAAHLLIPRRMETRWEDKELREAIKAKVLAGIARQDPMRKIADDCGMGPGSLRKFVKLYGIHLPRLKGGWNAKKERMQ